VLSVCGQIVSRQHPSLTDKTHVRSEHSLIYADSAIKLLKEKTKKTIVTQKQQQ
jgi:hypothetical protein